MTSSPEPAPVFSEAGSTTHPPPPGPPPPDHAPAAASGLFALLRDARIRTKVLLIPVLAGLLAVALGGWGLGLIDRYDQAFRETVITNLARTEAADQIVGTLTTATRALHRAVHLAAIGDRRETIQRAVADFNAQLAMIRAQVKALHDQAHHDEAEQERFRRVLADLDEADDNGRNVSEMLGVDLVAAASFLRANQNTFDDLTSHIRRLVEVQRGAIALRQTKLAEQAKQFKILMVGSFVLALVVFGAVALAIIRSLTGPVTALSAVMDRLARGTLCEPVPETRRRDEIGAMARALQVFQDVAIARLQAETERNQEHERWRTVLEQSPVAISIVARESRKRLYVNPKFLALFGYPGRSTAEAMPIEQSFAEAADYRFLIAASERSETVSAALFKRYRADGSVWWCLLDMSPIDYGGCSAYIVWQYDVTDRTLAQQELLIAKDRAEAALTRLQDAQQRLIQMEKMVALSQLVSGIAHEINTPIGTALTCGSLWADLTEALKRRTVATALRRSDLDRYFQDAEEAGTLLLANLRRIGDLVQSFKQVAADQIQDQRRRFDLRDWLDELMIGLKPNWRQAGHQLLISCDEGIEIDGYPGVMSLVVTHLAMNAIEHGFTSPDKPGTMTITVTESEPGMIELAFADDGQGIASADQDRVFEPFFTTSRNAGHTGLGLHVVFNLVTAKLGGWIELDRTVTRGARFVIHLPKVQSGLSASA